MKWLVGEQSGGIQVTSAPKGLQLGLVVGNSVEMTVVSGVR